MPLMRIELSLLQFGTSTKHLLSTSYSEACQAVPTLSGSIRRKILLALRQKNV